MSGNTSIPGDKRRRAMLQSLPKLAIPGNYRPEPEEITISRRLQFLTFCGKNGRAPPSEKPKTGIRLANHPQGPSYAAATLPPAVLYNENPRKRPSAAEKADGKEVKNTREKREGGGDSEEDPDADLPTLEFDERDRRVLARRQQELENAKAEHGRWIALLHKDPRDSEALRNCRYWGGVREEIRVAMELIPERLRIRREFREEFNRKWGLLE